MKQSKKAKLPLAIQTVRSLSKPLGERELENVAGGTTWPSGPLSKCAQTTICTG